MRSSQEIFAGLGLGAAVGILVGMSNAPVVAIVVSALVALVATFFGLSAQGADGAKVLRIAAFSIGLPIAVLFGLAARTHDWLSPTLQQQAQKWIAAGYTPEEARSYVAFRELGIVPEGFKTAEPPKHTGLFSSESQKECGNLTPSKFGSTELRISAMQSAGGDWKALADAASQIDISHRTAVLDAGYRLACP